MSRQWKATGGPLLDRLKGNFEKWGMKRIRHPECVAAVYTRAVQTAGGVKGHESSG